MSPTAHISRRDYIQRGNGEPSEPTSTIVLTSKSGWYIDVRILLPTPRATPKSISTPAEIRSEDEAFLLYTNQQGSLPISRCDWAFAGQSHSTPPSPAGETGKPGRSSWEHWVDSQISFTEDGKMPAVEDEGDMYALDDGRTLEKGESVDEEGGGEVRTYEEMWSGISISLPKAWEGLGKASCVVAVCDDVQGSGVRGCVMRLGQYAQGVLRKGSEFLVERWIWGDLGDDGGKEGWRLLLRIGEGDFGCSALVGEDESSFTVGKALKAGGYEWKITEVDREW